MIIAPLPLIFYISLTNLTRPYKAWDSHTVDLQRPFY